MKQQGILQNLILRPKDKKHEIVAGERRYLAAKIAELKTVPAVVRDLSDEQVIEIQLIENLQRADVHPMEEAEGYEQLMKAFGHPIEEIYNRVSKSRSYVYGRLKLLDLNEKCREAFYKDKISASIALLIARIPAPPLQNRALSAMSVGDQCVSFRRAKDIIHRNFMLRLNEAPFGLDDETLVKPAGSCKTCPYRTGNDPDLFGDVKGANTCTLPSCYEKKVKAHGRRLLRDAEKENRVVISGKEASAARARTLHKKLDTHITNQHEINMTLQAAAMGNKNDD